MLDFGGIAPGSAIAVRSAAARDGSLDGMSHGHFKDAKRER
ncbi:hypothetical protein [Streptomyces sp. NPDC102437]